MSCPTDTCRKGATCAECLLADEEGVCMNCGAGMDYSPMHPWCSDCDEDDEED